MLLIRQIYEETERNILSPHAIRACNSKGREKEEIECNIRTCYQRDRDRIIHSKSFRQLKYKTQVFLIPATESVRTRLTHTIEVAQIARTIARALRLNEDLTEAIALGHDLGHPPFGHAGEKALNEVCPGGFQHPQQSLRVVELLEKAGDGLNLTIETKDGILKHSRGPSSLKINSTDKPITLEGSIVRLADSIAYINHDIDDAISAGIITFNDLPKDSINILKETHAARINTMVSDIIFSSFDRGEILMSTEVLDATDTLRDYLYKSVYPDERIQREAQKAKRVIRELFNYYFNSQKEILSVMGYLIERGEKMARVICDYIAAMSDREALRHYEEIFLPKPLVEGE